MSHAVAEMLHKAADLCSEDKCPKRSGNILKFSAGEKLIVAGDLHGNRANLAKILKYANPGSASGNILILQELLHGGPTDENGGDRSVELLMRAARAKIKSPESVYFIMSNHDITELIDGEITKNGQGACKSFRLGLANSFGEDADEILQTIKYFVRSLPIAARCENNMLISHSVPSPGRIKYFDPEIFDRPYEDQDFRRGHSIYEFVWGRRQDDDALETLSNLLGCDLFLNGHQPQDNGYCHNGRQLIIASDHAAATLAEFDAGDEITPEMFVTVIKKLSSL